MPKLNRCKIGLTRRETMPLIPTGRPSLARLYAGYLLDVPEYCPHKKIRDTNERFDVRVTEPLFCECKCIHRIRKDCEAYKWLQSTKKTRIRIQREGS